MEFNRYLIQHDDERRLALRSELKRSLAALTIKQERLAELQAIVDKLDRDSDDASDEHSAATSKLQAELDELDKQHVEALLANKPPTVKSLTRRLEILNSLADLNTKLETRTEANRRSKIPFESQMKELRQEIAKNVTLEDQLTRLCSPEARAKLAVADFDVDISESGLSEARRRFQIRQTNYQNSKHWDDRQRHESEDTLIQKAKYDEALALVIDRQQRLDAALEASRKAQQDALSE